MPIETRRHRSGTTLLGFAAILSLVLSAPALAQADAPGKAERTWTDPPVRGSAATAVPDAPKSGERAIAPEPAAAASQPVRHARDARSGTKSRGVARTASRPRARIATRHVDELHRRARMVAAARPPAAIRSPGVRMIALRPGPWDDDAPLPHVRHGYIEDRIPVGHAFEDERAHRIRQAREAGYIVVRARRGVVLDGPLLRSYRPYEPDDVDD